MKLKKKKKEEEQTTKGKHDARINAKNIRIQINKTGWNCGWTTNAAYRHHSRLEMFTMSFLFHWNSVSEYTWHTTIFNKTTLENRAQCAYFIAFLSSAGTRFFFLLFLSFVTLFFNLNLFFDVFVCYDQLKCKEKYTVAFILFTHRLLFVQYINLPFFLCEWNIMSYRCKDNHWLCY